MQLKGERKAETESNQIKNATYNFIKNENVKICWHEFFAHHQGL